LTCFFAFRHRSARPVGPGRASYFLLESIERVIRLGPCAARLRRVIITTSTPAITSKAQPAINNVLGPIMPDVATAVAASGCGAFAACAALSGSVGFGAATGDARVVAGAPTAGFAAATGMGGAVTGAGAVGLGLTNGGGTVIAATGWTAATGGGEGTVGFAGAATASGGGG
jgi:hypothetical protein